MSARMRAHWIAVACAEHVQRGRDGGFMQVCHGKAAPLRRIRPGDCVIYYSPTRSLRGSDKLQAFTAIGVVAAGEPYIADMGNGIRPARRDVTWLDARPAAIAPLIGALAFTAGRSWGMRLRAGLVAIETRDAALIAAAMGAAMAVAATPPCPSPASGGGNDVAQHADPRW